MKSNSSFKEFYDDGYKKAAFEAHPSPSEAYCWHKMKQSIQKFFTEEVKKAGSRPLAVLDLGCGTGKDIFNLGIHSEGKAIFCGIDISPAAISHAKKVAHNMKYKGIEFFVGDVVDKNSWPKKLRDMKFDIIMSSEVLEHLEHHEPFIKTISSSLAEGGCLILSSPNKKYFLKKIYDALPQRLREKYKKTHNERFGKISHETGHISVSAYEDIHVLLKSNNFRIEKAIRGAPFYGGSSVDKNKISLCSYIFLDAVLPNKPYFGWEFVIKARKI